MKRLLLFAVIVAGCKQGKGDRCQITDDCQAPLICSAATGTCTDNTSTGIDATVPDAPSVIDAPKQMDAPKMDAPKLDAD
ncbi:MAG TPA: hypothetical protein VLX92_05050 [Kofleriaceae bacterium]|nr:hypothetical protein [Kofleriaceae bacterium]